MRVNELTREEKKNYFGGIIKVFGIPSEFGRDHCYLVFRTEENYVRVTRNVRDNCFNVTIYDKPERIYSVIYTHPDLAGFEFRPRRVVPDELWFVSLDLGKKWWGEEVSVEPIIVDTQLYDDSEYEPLKKAVGLESDNRKKDIMEIFNGASYEFGKVFKKLDELNRMKLSARYIKLFCMSHKCEECPLFQVNDDGEGDCKIWGSSLPSEWDID